MTRLLLAAALLVAAPLVAAADGAPPERAAAPVHGKPQAPVAASAHLDGGRATVTVRFLSPATEASVEVHGVDGLVVTSDATPLTAARFGRGETVTFDVAYTDAAGTGQLAVSVAGRFAGARRMATVSFAERAPTPAELKRSGTATDAGGRRLRLLPADPR